MRRGSTPPAPPADPLAGFHPAVAGWFCRALGEPTAAQAATWPLLARGEHVLLAAPTGSGKTLAAFLTAIDRLARPAAPRGPASGSGVRVLYISPLKALDNDVHRNLQAPIAGIAAEAARRGETLRMPTVAVRTGDTPASARARQVRTPPDILITTPESLFLLLTSPRALPALARVETVIVDEIHAMAGTKRGTHLALSLERLERLAAGGAPQRVGLSATQRPLETIAAFLGGRHDVTVVDRTAPGPSGSSAPRLDLRVTVPVPDFRDIPGDSVWDAIAPLVLEDVRAHRTTLIFVPNRGRAESLTRRLNDLAGEEICRAHHGSVSREAREQVEAALKGGQLRALCATATLELGIDVGAIDLAILVGSPGAVSRGLQRVGRAGHQVGGTSAGRIVCRTAPDLAEAAIVAREMRLGRIEATRVPRGALDVLAQHVVSMAAVEDWTPAALLDLVRRAHPYRDLGADDLQAVLELVSGRYGTRPLATWDREARTVRARPGSSRAAIRGVGTIPDRGAFGVYGPDGGRLGELDEEFVHESRRGDSFVLGTTVWRIAAITHDRVLVTPGAGALPRVPFWHGDGPGRPAELGEALLRFWGDAQRHLGGSDRDGSWWADVAEDCRLEAGAARALRSFVAEQAAAGCLPSPEQLVLEWYRDPLGDLRVCLHAPLGRAVTRPWSLALRAMLLREAGVAADAAVSDNGFLLRLPARPDGSGRPAGGSPADLLVRWSPRALEDALVADLPRTALFAARFREVAGRALLLERGDGRRRAPLWLQRLRAADLLAAVRRYPDFPLVQETLRECLEDAFDVPAWRAVLEAVAARRIAVAVRERPGPSPLASELEFRFKAEGLYAGDAPRAEAGAADLAAGLAEEDGAEAAAGAYLEKAEAALRRRLWGRPRSADELHDRFLRVGPVLPAEVAEDERGLLAELRAAGRVVEADGRLVAAEDVAAWGAAAAGLPEARTAWVLRWASAVPGLTPEEVRRRFGWEPPDLGALGLVPLGGGRYGHPAVRRMVRRRALALARAEIAPVSRDAFAEFVWRRQAGGDAAACLGRLQGCFLPVEVWLEQVLPAKIPGFRAADLDRLLARGEFLWAARGDAVAFFAREDYPALAAAPAAIGGPPELAAALAPGSAPWFADLRARTGMEAGALAGRLAELARAGAISNDALEPLRAKPSPGQPAQGGRWWPLPPAAPQAEAWAAQMLGRYGVVSREVWELAGPPVPWSAGVPALERAGALRGHFVRGLGGLQFARPADVDGLREVGGAAPGGTRVIGGCDPACVWREAPRRPGSFVVVQAGRPALQCSAHGRLCKPLRELPAAALAEVAAALHQLPGPRGRVEVAEWDGAPVLDAPAAVLEALTAAGFRRGPTSLRWRRAAF